MGFIMGRKVEIKLLFGHHVLPSGCPSYVQREATTPRHKMEIEIVVLLCDSLAYDL